MSKAAGQHSAARVAVIVPCYNHAHYLPETIASVAGQTFADWEIVIINNGSTDTTDEVARQLITRFKPRHIRLISQSAGGPGAGRNTGMQATHAPFLLPLDADDLLDARFLEKTVPLLERNPGLGFVSTNVRFFGSEQGSWSGGEPTLERMLYDSRTTVSALVRRDAWQQAGGFCEQRDWQRYEDWDFWLRVLERGWQGALLPEELLWYRRHPSSSHTRNQRDDLIYRARLVVDHPSLYHRAFHDWARRVVREASMPTPARRWRWFGLYALLIARFAPRELPKTLLRPAFKSIGPAQQMYARRIAQLLRLSRAA